MSRRYRIAHVITRLELGGAQQNTLYCVRHHDRERFDVELIAGSGDRLDDEARSIPDADVRLVPWLKHPVSPGFDAFAVLALRNHFRRSGVDLVHTHSSKAGILGRVAARLAGVPAVVHTVHGWSFNDTQSSVRRALYRGLERRVARLTDRLLVVAERHRDVGLAAGIGGPHQYGVLRSGIDPERFAGPARPRESLRAELGCGEQETLVGTVANMKPQKAPLDFVAVAERARRENPRLRFVIAGDGPLMPAVRRAVLDRGLEDAVRVLGWREDVADLLHAMDLFLLTSRFEGLPRVVLQATAAGRPVVATAVDGTPEVIEDGVSGLLAPPGDVEALARQLLRLADDPALARRLVEAARRRLRGSFDIREMVRQLDALYLTLLEGRP